MEPGSRTIAETELLENLTWVQALARRLVSDPTAAEDVAQDAWLRALEQPPRQVDPSNGLRGWLSRVTRTLAWQRMQSGASRQRREEVVARAEAVPSASDVVAKGEMQMCIVEAVMSLPEPERTTVLLRYLEGQNAREVAEQRGESPEAVRQRLSRALVVLRGRLEREFGGDQDGMVRALTPLAHLGGQKATPLGTWYLLGGAFVSMKVVIGVAAVTVALVAAAAIDWQTEARGPAERPDPSFTPVAGSASTGTESEPEAREDPASTRVVVDVQENDSVADAASDEVQIDQELGQQLESVLRSFYGPNPRIDELRDVVSELGELASVIPGSVSRNEATGEITGRVEIPAINRSGTFRIRDNRFTIELSEWYAGEEEYAQRALSIQFTPENEGIETGQLAVQHQFDVRDPAVLDRFDDKERVVGWVVNTDLTNGTKGTPIVASRSEDGAGLVIGHSRSGQVDAIAREWDWDLGDYGSWYRLLQAHRRE